MGHFPPPKKPKGLRLEAVLLSAPAPAVMEPTWAERAALGLVSAARGVSKHSKV